MTTPTPLTLDDLATPALILDRSVLERNAARMGRRMTDLGVNLRPHMKTAKSVEVARIATAGHSGGVTVSTLAEARYLAERGLSDITWAVALSPQKIAAAAALQAEFGLDLKVLTDSVALAREIATQGPALPAQLPARLSVLIEVDCGGGRAGVTLDDPQLIEIAHILNDARNVSFEGVLTHAGQSYHCRSRDDIVAVAATERDTVVAAARALEAQGIACRTISAGSTPTAAQADHLDGLTEMRPGVYMFSDLTQAALGWGGHDDIAVTVLATVIGHRRDLGQILIDAGGLALSKDRGMDEHDAGVGMGLLRDKSGQNAIPGLYVADTHQEHGILRMNDGTAPPWDALPVGARVRVLPVHICMTAAAYDSYHVVADGGDAIIDEWSRARGW